MIEVFTKAIVREIGRNVGKAASNMLLGDSHSTPYRRVGVSSSNKTKNVSTTKKTVLGSNSGGYKYENNLDRLIKKFQIRGKIATFNSAQNIYNEYFILVAQAYKDENFSLSEISYLIKQYHRTLDTLNTIARALAELGAKEKSKIVIDKMLSMKDFMIELDNNFEYTPLVEIEPKTEKEPENSNKSRFRFGCISGVVSLTIFLFLFIVFLSKTIYLYSFVKTILIFVMVLAAIVYFISWLNKKNKINKTIEKNKEKYQERQRILKRNQYIEKKNNIKEKLTQAANSIEIVQKSNIDDYETDDIQIKYIDPLNLNYFKNRDA